MNTTTTSPQKHWFRAKLPRFLLLTAFFIGAFVFILPIIWLVLGSFKVDAELRSFPVQIFPGAFRWSNYVEAFTAIPYLTYMVRSFLLALTYAVLTVFSSAFVGFGFARHNVPGRNQLFLVVVAMMIVPQIVTIIPQYILYSRYGIINTYWPWILWGLSAAPFHIFLFRQFFMSFPKELEEAAELDGCNRFQVFRRIFLPNARAPMIVTFIFAFSWVWGDFFTQSLFLSSENATLAMRLASAYTNPQGYPIYSLTMAGAVMYSLPLILIFFMAQKYFVEGIVTTGIK